MDEYRKEREELERIAADDEADAREQDEAVEWIGYDLGWRTDWL